MHTTNTLGKYITLLFVSLITFSSLLNAQTKTFYGQEVTTISRASYASQFADYRLFKVDAKALADHLKERSSAQRIELQLGRSFNWDLVLFENDLRAANYQLRIASEQGIQVAATRENINFAGCLADGSGEVRLTIREGFIFGYIEEDGLRHFIEPARRFDRAAASNEFIVYSSNDVLPDKSVKCGVTDMQKIAITPVEPEQAGDRSVACKELQLAIATDLSMFNKFNDDAPSLEAYVFGVMNGAETDYSGSFNDNIEFVVVEVFVSTSSGTDPVSASTTDSGVVLPDFATWAGTNFSNTHDLGQFWTNRDFDGTTIGLAYVGGLCFGSFGYHILQDFRSTNACLTQALVSHEIGHNFDASHDGSGDPYIMAPAVQCISAWSAASVSSINGLLGSTSCLSTCSSVFGAPVAQFGANTTLACNGTAISFTDLSTNTPSSWSWTFTGGSPSSSSSQNPTVTYSTNGTYEVSLTATNSSGSDAETKTGYITVVNAVDAATTPNDASSGSGGIFGVRLNGMLVLSEGTSAEGSYEDYSCAGVVNLEVSSSYDLLVNVGPRVNCVSSSAFEGVRAYIDYNGDGDFDDTGESLVPTLSFLYCGEADPISFTTPASPATNELLRLRIVSEDGGMPDDSDFDPAEGQVEDYAVYFAAALPVELVRFEGQLKEDQVELQWETATEKNNDFFVLERSGDGRQFTEMTKIIGAGNSFELINYAYLDERPLIGQNYYRLKQVDFDGSTTFSDIVVIDYQPKSTIVTIQPNPFKGNGFQLSYFSQGSEPVQLEVYNITGQLLYRSKEAIESGVNTFQMPASDWTAGVYFLQIRQGTVNSTHRLVKQ